MLDKKKGDIMQKQNNNKSLFSSDFLTNIKSSNKISSKNLKTHYDCIDLMEFLGMLFVLMYHSTTVKYNILNDTSIWTYIHYLVRPILSTCVPLFFFANGFLLINRKFDLKKHIKKTIWFILITIIWGAITLLILMFIEGEYFTIKGFIASLIHWKGNYINHLWYMGSIICIYFLFPLIKNSFDHNRNVFNYWVVICLIFAFGNVILGMAVTFLSHYILGRNVYFTYNFFGMFNPLVGLYAHSFGYFCLGALIGGNHIILQEKLKKLKFVNKKSLFMVVILSTFLLGLWGIFSTNLIGKSWDVVWNGYDTIFTLINVLAIYQLSNFYKYNGGKVGKYTNSFTEYFRNIFYSYNFSTFDTKT